MWSLYLPHCKEIEMKEKKNCKQREKVRQGARYGITVKLGYTIHGCTEFTFMTNKNLIANISKRKLLNYIGGQSYKTFGAYLGA